MSPSGLVVHECGTPDGPELVLLHGLTEAGTTWPDAVDRWAADWRILAPDLRGHGDSLRFSDAQLTSVMEVMVADVIALLESVCRGPALLLGHSLGGRVGVLVASRRPDLVERLVLEDPALASVAAATESFVAEQEAFLDTFADGGAAEISRMRAVTSWSDAEIRAWAACKSRVDRAMIAHLHLGEWDVAAVLNDLRVPTLLVVPADGETARHRGIVSNPLVGASRLPNVGHCVRRDDPEAFHAVVDPFLASSPDSSDAPGGH
ncbi:alpha/beta fold hydrolase [Ornithinimicrobium faecis]|uniref:alpha/beta fold hydrolase n=1 Tax=Ornithinimicrobium faecis TaxID=2934158 RepID=UPI002119900C|nr:alpha/beta hydrolase [Ornithinimicrobium sp. HY1745]